MLHYYYDASVASHSSAFCSLVGDTQSVLLMHYIFPFKKISQVLAISVTELVLGEKPEWHDVLERITMIERVVAELRSDLSSRI